MFHKMRPSVIAVIVLALLGGAVPSRAQTTYYVDGDCGHDEWCNGESSDCWNEQEQFQTCAKRTIQQGLCAATQDGDTVIVAQGEYKGGGNVDLMFPRSGAEDCPPPYDDPGTAIALTLRCETGEDPELCIIDSEGGDEDGNCTNSTPDDDQHRAFYFYQDSASNDSVIEGFTIKNGCMYYRENEPGTKNYGGGIFIYKSQPTIRNCVFTGNRARKGGAIALEGYNAWDPGWLPMIENCTIYDNRAIDLNGVAVGGGIWADGHIDPLIKDCVITDNCTSLTIFAGSACNCSLPDCVSGQGGGVWLGQGCDPQIEGTALQDASVVANNAAGEGGGVYIQNVKEYELDRNVEHPRILRTRVGPNNRAKSGYGGGIRVASNWVWNDDDYPLFIEDCEIIENHADASNGGGLSVYASGSGVQGIQVVRVTMANVIIAGNTAVYGGGDGSWREIRPRGVESHLRVQYRWDRWREPW